MGLFGKIIAAPVRIVNAPIKAATKLMDIEDSLERPLEVLADELEKVDSDDEENR